MIDQYKCGGCSNDTYHLFDDSEERCLVAKCTKCGSENLIKARATLSVDKWRCDDQLGGMCTGWGN